MGNTFSNGPFSIAMLVYQIIVCLDSFHVPFELKTWLGNLSCHYHSHIIHDRFKMSETISQQFPNPVILSVKVYRISSFLLGLCCLFLRHGPTQIVKGRNWGKVVNIVTLTCRHGIPSGFKGTSSMVALFNMDIVSTWSSTM